MCGSSGKGLELVCGAIGNTTSMPLIGHGTGSFIGLVVGLFWLHIGLGNGVREVERDGSLRLDCTVVSGEKVGLFRVNVKDGKTVGTGSIVRVEVVGNSLEYGNSLSLKMAFLVMYTLPDSWRHL